MKLGLMQKPKTRRLRGIEPVVAAVILIVIAIAAGVILYFMTSGFAGSTPVPKMQLDPYNSKIIGSTAYIVLKPGEDIQRITSIEFYDANGQSAGQCSTPQGKFQAGTTIEITCTNIVYSHKYFVVVRYMSGNVQKVFRGEWLRS
mgnify:CR=1 FL=1